MANEHRVTQLPVIDILLKYPYKFSFEQSVFILSKFYKLNTQHGCEASLNSSKISTFSKHSLHLLSSEVHSIKMLEDKSVIYAERMSVTSINSPLPNVYIENVKLAEWRKEYAFPEFLTIFTNRLAGISYLTSVRRYPSMQMKNSNETNVGKCINSLTGSSNKKFLQQYAYLIWSRPRTLLGLRSILEDFFSVPINIEPFNGAFIKINDVTILKHKNSHLGINAFIGNSFFNYDASIKISIGPLDNEQIQDFQKGNCAYNNLSQILDAYLDDSISCHIDIIPQNPNGTTLNFSKLGYDCWINNKEKTYEFRRLKCYLH